MLKRLALGLLALWAAAGFLQEVNAAVAGWDARDWAVRALPWRFGAPEPAALGRCLGEARRTIPPGSVVAFAAPDAGGNSGTSAGTEIALMRWRWAAYLLPEDDVLPAGDPAAARVATWVVAFRTEIHDPRVEPVRPLPDGWLYRVKRP
jgi:hypothetical protein